MDSIKSQLDQLAELGEEALTELADSMVAEFDKFASEEQTADNVAAMTELADMLDTVRGEMQRRETLAAELTQQAAEAAMRVKGEEVPSEEVVPAEEAEDAEEAPEADDAEEDKVEMSTEASAEVEDESEASVDEEAVAEASVEVEELAEASNDPEEGVAEETEAVAEASTDEVVLEVTDEVTEASTDEVVAEDVLADAEASIQETPQEIASEVAQEEATVTAAAEGTFEAPADRRPVAEETAFASVAITAGADIPGYTAGSTINDLHGVAEAMEKRLHSLRRVNGGDGEQHIVASFSTSYPEDRVLTADAESNFAKIQNVVGAEALVASGGHATPFQVKYDVFGLGTNVRPVRDALPRFQADRGGVRYVIPPVLSSYANAVGIWTNATDADPQSDTKASLTVSAASETTASTDAVTLQMQFGNLFTRAYPELLARHNELGLIQHAREAEQNITTQIGNLSTAVTTTNLIGFGRDFLVQLRRAGAAYRSRHRLAADAVLKAIIPAWVYDAMAADLILNMPGDNNLGVSKSEIDGYIAQANIDLIPSLDLGVYGSQGASALTEFADSFTWYLFAEGTFLFLDGGTLDLGIIRDSTLVGTNDYKMFVETFEGVAKVGVEALAITSTISVNGAAAALRDTTGNTAAATIEL